MVTGTSFNLYTDQRPLVSTVTTSKTSDAWSERQLSTIAEARASVQYLPGNMNPVADALSCIIFGNLQPGIYYRQMAEQQETDAETKTYRDSVTNLQWAEVDTSGILYTV